MAQSEFISKKLLFNYCTSCQTIPGSAEELQQFAHLQKEFSSQFENFFPDNYAHKTIVVIPSLTLDEKVLLSVDAAMYYEERLLCLLMLLRMPCAQVIYVSSAPIDNFIIDYYLHLLPGITGYHASERLTMLSCSDTSIKSLTEKILERPRLIERIKQQIPANHAAHIACFNTTAYERTLAVRLGIPIYGCDPSLIYIGTKSGSRCAFLQAGVLIPDGQENVKTKEDIVLALTELKRRNPTLKKAVVKLNDGFSGDGNALFHYPANIELNELQDWTQQHLLTQLKPVAKKLSASDYLEIFIKMEGIVETFIEGSIKTSPSVQCRINPLGEVDIISTHDQVLNDQVFVGAFFPADASYSFEIAELSKKISIVLRDQGVLGRFSVDFISVKENNSWKHYALEINIRKGGTTHPYLMLQFLTDGKYDDRTGIYETATKQQRYYYSSDNIQNNAYKGLSAKDLIEIAIFHGLHFDGATQKGVMFHMIGALSQYGKMGIVCIGASKDEALYFYNKTIEVLDYETAIR